MLIASKLPPATSPKTYFNLGRSAFAYLLGEIVKPEKVYLPSFTCWSLVNTIERRYPEIELDFYNVDRYLNSTFPALINDGEVLVVVHFFGKENQTPLPPKKGGIIFEDVSHSFASKIKHFGDFIFGSLRKTFKIADGGIILNKFLNPVYEKSNNLDSWLRLQALDWKDLREAENMLDRQWKIRDISSQSLEVVLKSNLNEIQKIRYKNWLFLDEHLKLGTSLINFNSNEAPLVQNIIVDDKTVRDKIRSHFSDNGIFTSIHWPAHPLIRSRSVEFKDAIWLEEHIISIPVSQDYNLNDMEYIVKVANKLNI